MGRSRARGDEGAVTVFVAVTMVLMLVAAAFAVDLGMQRVLRRDLQALADVVATDLARELDGRTAEAIVADPGWAAAQEDSLERNDGGIDDAPDLSATLGVVDAAHTFTPVSGATVPTAVRVVASGDVAFAFASGSGGSSRSAVSVSRAQACYKLGSWGARLDTRSSTLLADVLRDLGVAATVDAATYRGLVGAGVDVAALAAELGLASPERLGSATVTLEGLLDAAARVLASDGATGAHVAALGVLRAGLGALAGEQVALGSLVDVATGAGAGLTAALDLADLAVGALLVATEGEAATIGLDVPVAGVVPPATADVELIQSARTACGFAGSTPNRSNQVELAATLVLNDTIVSGLVDDLLGLLGVSIDAGTVTVEVTSVQATSSLDEVGCDPSSRTVTVATNGGLLGATLRLPLRVTGPLGGSREAVLGATLTPSGTPGDVTITVPGQSYDTPYPSGGTVLALPPDVVSEAGGPLSEVLAGVVELVLVPVVSWLNTMLLGPLSELAGLRTVGADVLLLDRPTCTTPALRG